MWLHVSQTPPVKWEPRYTKMLSTDASTALCERIRMNWYLDVTWVKHKLQNGDKGGTATTRCSTAHTPENEIWDRQKVKNPIAVLN